MNTYLKLSGFVRRLASLLLVAGAPVFAFQSEGTVRIGLFESQTGTFAPFGLPGLWGSLIAIDEINAAGGVTIDSKKVRIVPTPAPNGYDAGSDSGVFLMPDFSSASLTR